MELHTDLGNIDALKISVSGFVNKKQICIIKVNETVTQTLFHPKGKLPVLSVGNGQAIFSGNSACRFFFGTSSEGINIETEEEWLEWEASQLQPEVKIFLGHHFGPGKSDVSGVREKLAELQNAINKKQFPVGQKITAVDIAIWSTLFPIFDQGLALIKDVRSTMPELTAWYDKLNEVESFKSGVKEIFQDDVKSNLKTSVVAETPPLNPSASIRDGHKAGKAASDKSDQGSSQGDAKPISREDSLTESIASLTSDEKKSAGDAWLNGQQRAAAPNEIKHPILPKAGEKNILITSALPYVNNVPHLGNIIGCVLSADVYARFCKLRNYNTLYICGTDEYGTATETKAMEEGLTPQQICDKYNALHTEIYNWFNIGFDYFGRTTTPQQKQVAQDIFHKLEENGFILRDSVDQLHCKQCDRFLADRFVEGTCPLCAYEDARGDQCDSCGKLINAIDLRNPRCKQCTGTPEVQTSNHLFLDLPQLQPSLTEYLDGEFEKGLWSSNAKVITKAWLRDGLKARCISRDLKWGIPVPLEGYENKVFYVWYDAPIGYISITANYTDQWERWWKNEKEVELYQFMAKDNIPFHSVIFPCTLIGTKQPWTKVNHLNATEYLNYEDTKFSKSRGVGVFGNNAQETGIPADIWRFYLLFLRPESQDSAFNWDDFMMKNNSELLNNLGNFINRALMFVGKSFGGVIPEVTLTEDDEELLAFVTRELKTYIDNLEKIKLRDGLRNILSISRLGNQYVQANKPWVLVKGNEEEKKRAGSVVGLAANVACLLSVLLQPYMPEVSKIIQQQVNAPHSCNVIQHEFYCYLQAGHKIGEPKPLFEKIEAAKIQELKQRYAGKQETVAEKKSVAEKKEVVQNDVILKPASEEEILRLTDAVTKQGGVVRELKTAKAEKSKIDSEVATLLSLKNQLSIAQGIDPTKAAKKPAGGGGKKKKVPTATLR